MDMSVWYLVGAILVFFMQCGFAAVEAGFTRAKNAGNIIMKNLMDFCIGTVVFMALVSCLLAHIQAYFAGPEGQTIIFTAPANRQGPFRFPHSLDLNSETGSAPR